VTGVVSNELYCSNSLIFFSAGGAELFWRMPSVGQITVLSISWIIVSAAPVTITQLPILYYNMSAESLKKTDITYTNV